MSRTLGRSGIEVSALGLGCWAIGGILWRDNSPLGWGEVSDEESIRAIHAAIDTGITFFDTADQYGAGHSEEVLGTALVGRRDKVVVATKFGQTTDEVTRTATGDNVDPAYVRQALMASLRRLRSDYIDLYQLHVADCPLDRAEAIRDTLESLVEDGRIRAYGWSTDDAARARLFAEGPNCAAIQQQLSVLGGQRETLYVCERYGLAALCRGPLRKGLLTGKFNYSTTFPDNDVRSGWSFAKGELAEELNALTAIREVLATGGRTVAHGALAWIWAVSDVSVPIPGFRNSRQVEENARALDFGPLSRAAVAEIDTILNRESWLSVIGAQSLESRQEN
jgi:aryl-alcohol dehydrogenase-like predicted oxidoreductase